MMKIIGKSLLLIGLVLSSMTLQNQGVQANTIVEFEIMGVYGSNGPSASFQVELYDTQAPISVANFLRYVNDRAYDNSIIHRNVRDHFVQGGGYNLEGSSLEESPNPTSLSAIVTYPPIENEPGISNLRGTLAVARMWNDLNSGKSQWYFNVSNNTYLDASSDGWAVFGRVLDSDMSVLDKINYTTNYDITETYGSVFGQVPLFKNSDTSLSFITVKSIRVVPEPSVLTLLCSCSVGVFAYARRRLKRTT